MSKQTKRPSFIKSQDRKNENENEKEKENNRYSIDYNDNISFSPGKTTGNKFFRGSKKMSMTLTSSADDLGMNKKMSKTQTSKWIRTQAPDFKKIISREHLERIYGDKRTIIPFSIPNFKITKPSNFLFYF